MVNVHIDTVAMKATLITEQYSFVYPIIFIHFKRRSLKQHIDQMIDVYIYTAVL